MKRLSKATSLFLFISMLAAGCSESGMESGEAEAPVSGGTDTPQVQPARTSTWRKRMGT